MSLGYGDLTEGKASPGEGAEAGGIGRDTPLRPPRQGPRRLSLLATGALALGLGMHAVLAPQSWHAGEGFWLALLLAAGSFVLVALTGPATAGGKIAPWLGVAVLIGVGLSYRHEVGDVVGRSLPPVKRSAAFAASPDTAYRIDANVDGKAVRFLVDTGASDIVFTIDDATRLGLQPSQLDFRDRIMTANGLVRAATVTLDQMRIGPITVRGLTAMVSDGDQAESVLGMSFLAKLAEVTIKDGALTIRQ
jgi:aspartyl protease family protein